jgi:hypothetical protein
VLAVNRPGKSGRSSAAAVVVVVVSFFFVLGLAGWAWFNCLDAIYHCPANGCGPISQPGCGPIVELFPYLLSGGILSGAIAFWMAVRSPRGAYANPRIGTP